MDTINVIYVEPGKTARTIEMKDELSEMQKLVGGLIEEYMPFEDDVAIICNDEGKMNGMPLNRAITGEDGQLMDIIAGPFFIAYAPVESEKFLSMPKELEEAAMIDGCGAFKTYFSIMLPNAKTILPPWV